MNIFDTKQITIIHFGDRIEPVFGYDIQQCENVPSSVYPYRTHLWSNNGLNAIYPTFTLSTLESDSVNGIHFFSIVLKNKEMPEDRNQYIDRMTRTIANFVRSVEQEGELQFSLYAKHRKDRNYEDDLRGVIEFEFDKKWGEFSSLTPQVLIATHIPCFIAVDPWTMLVELGFLNSVETIMGNELEKPGGSGLPDYLGIIEIAKDLDGIDTKGFPVNAWFRSSPPNTNIEMVMIIRCIDVSTSGMRTIKSENFKVNTDIVHYLEKLNTVVRNATQCDLVFHVPNS